MMNQTYQKLSTGLRINDASDGPSEMAIGERFESSIREQDQRTRNALDSQSMVKIEEGKLQQHSDALQKARELSVQYQNDTYTSQDKQYIEEQFRAITEDFGSEYGLKGSDVGDIEKVDEVIEEISNQRSEYGSEYNAYGYEISNRRNYSENLSSARSTMIDTDYAKSTSELSRYEVLLQSSNLMQKYQQENEKGRILSLIT